MTIEELATRVVQSSDMAYIRGCQLVSHVVIGRSTFIELVESYHGLSPGQTSFQFSHHHGVIDVISRGTLPYGAFVLFDLKHRPVGGQTAKGQDLSYALDLVRRACPMSPQIECADE